MKQIGRGIETISIFLELICPECFRFKAGQINIAVEFSISELDLALSFILN